MARFILVALLCISLASLALCDDKWSYDLDAADGPKHWKGVCANGKRQSPIDIKSDDETYDSSLGKFYLQNYDKKLNLNFTASNNGHALKVAFPEFKYQVTGGGLHTPLFSYTTIQLHLHWGSDKSKGSEHTMNGKSYAAELHFVSYNKEYPNASVALTKSNGLAVLGVFIEVEGTNNTAFSFLEIARKLQNGSKDTKEDIPAFKFDDLLPSNKSKYHRYEGSLTTPKCNEAVTWTVFDDPIKMSQYQMDLLRSLKKEDSTPIVDNFRPVQPLNNRTVRASFHVPKTTKTTKTTEGTTPTTTEAGASAVISLFFVNVVCLAFIALF